MRVTAILLAAVIFAAPAFAEKKEKRARFLNQTPIVSVAPILRLPVALRANVQAHADATQDASLGAISIFLAHQARIPAS